MIKKNTIPTILGIIVLLLGTFAGIFLLNNTEILKTGADTLATPSNVRVANISDNSATISWTTDKATDDFLVWGTSQDSLSKTENEDANNGLYFNHTITLTGLNSTTTYYYGINSNGTTTNNSGWQFTTGATLDSNTNSILVSGNVINASGNSEKRALVYLDVSGYLFSTITSNTGDYVFQIGSARTPDLQKYAQILPNQTLLQISVQAKPDGVASAQIYPQSANPVSPIIIGQTYDFTNEPVNSQGSSPNVNLSLPQDSTQESKFNITIPSSTPNPTSVILESLQEGETITTTKPQFFGKGPPGENITITVHSQDPTTQTVQIPKNNESWNYTVPSSLTPGNHTITISWVDVSGITRFLTRDFVVEAGEVPAFTASQSGSTPTPTPAVFATASSTFSPSPIASATAMPVPVTGDLTPTLLLFIMGLAVMTFSFVVWKIAEN